MAKKKTSRREMLKKAGVAAVVAGIAGAQGDADAQIMRRRQQPTPTPEPTTQAPPVASRGVRDATGRVPGGVSVTETERAPVTGVGGGRQMAPAQFRNFFDEAFQMTEARTSKMTANDLFRKYNVSVQLPPAAARKINPLLARPLSGGLANECGICGACGACAFCGEINFGAPAAALIAITNIGLTADTATIR
jgi:hypothetical protein